jgi:hypothetical protein
MPVIIPPEQYGQWLYPKNDVTQCVEAIR